MRFSLPLLVFEDEIAACFTVNNRSPLWASPLSPTGVASFKSYQTVRDNSPTGSPLHSNRNAGLVRLPSSDDKAFFYNILTTGGRPTTSALPSKISNSIHNFEVASE